MVPNTLQNSLSLTFQDKMNSFLSIVCSCEIPMFVFNRLQSHQKQEWQNKFKTDVQRICERNEQKKF